MKNMISLEKMLVAKLTSNRAGQMKSYTAILLVSVGKENFEAEAIQAAVDMINDEFKFCVIAVADTLQRHNIVTEKEISHKEAYEASLQEGDEWIKRNESYFLKGFTIPYTIIRWDSLIRDPEFEKKEKIFSSFIADSEPFSIAMRESIEEYGKRLLKHLGEEHFKRIEPSHRQSCFSYLKEECVALTLLPKHISTDSNEHTPCVIVYPGKPTLILTENREIFIKNEFSEILRDYSDFLNWISYRFNRIKKHENASHDAFSSKSRKDVVELQDELLFLKQVDFINNLSETQLDSIRTFLDGQILLEFQKHLLNFFLNRELFLVDEGLPSVEGEVLSIQSVAYLFGMQLLAMFNTLEKKFSNKCKANIVRILKREIQIFTNVDKLVDFSRLPDGLTN